MTREAQGSLDRDQENDLLGRPRQNFSDVKGSNPDEEKQRSIGHQENIVLGQVSFIALPLNYIYTYT